ncbi:hypothetical protein FPRO04_14587 [Fusarium proliferatum]|nr:hypothetical protein FPRO04_14587 [Fusarium proliferatum]
MLANEQQLTITYRPVNGRKVSIGDGDVESELSELASTVHSASGVDFNELEDEIIVGACINGARKSCPLRPASDPEDETMADADDEPVASHYPKRKRTSVFHNLSESKMEPVRSLSDERQPPAAATRAKVPQTSTGRVKGVILGYWRDSPGPTEQAFYPYSIFHMERFLYGLRIPPRMEAYSIRMEYKK